MQIKPHARTGRWLMAAGIVLGAAAATAANSASVTPEQESMIKVGMSPDAVRQTLGTPASVITPSHEAGPTWTYGVATRFDHTIFEVAFDAAGRVASVDERQLPVE